MKSYKKIKRRIGAVVVLGIFMALLLAQPVAATDYLTGAGGGTVGISTTEGRIYFDNQATDEIEMLDARVGIGDTSPDGIFEVNPDGTEDNGDEIVVDTNGRLGIGTTSPQEKLDINGKLHMRDNIKLNGHWLTNDGDDEGVYVASDGKVGVGVQPVSALTVLGGAVVSTTWAATYPAPSGGLIVENNVGFGSINPNRALEINSASGENLRLVFNDNNGPIYSYGYTDFETDNAGNLYIKPTGTGVCIGTPRPKALLEVTDSALSTYGGSPIGYFGTDTADAVALVGDSTSAVSIGVPSGYNIGVFGQGDDYGGYFRATSTSYLDIGVYSEGTNYAGYFVGKGYFSDDVGIGIAVPNDELEVVGDASADRFVARTGAADVEFADEDGTDGMKIENSDSNPNIWIGDYSVSSNDFRGIYMDGYYDTTSIGTVDSSSRLVVASKDGQDDALRLLGPDGDYAHGARLNFGDEDYVYIEEDEDDKLYVYADDRIALMGSNVGIGETTPLTKLYVDGDVAFGEGSELTISSGVATVTHSYHLINAESGNSDDLTAISGYDVAGQILIISAASGDTITVTDGLNLYLANDTDFSMDDKDTMVLMYNGSIWLEISRSEN